MLVSPIAMLKYSLGYRKLLHGFIADGSKNGSKATGLRPRSDDYVRPELLSTIHPALVQVAPVNM